jgi:hypothetical protein
VRKTHVLQNQANGFHKELSETHILRGLRHGSRRALIGQLYDCYRVARPAGTFGELLSRLAAQLRYRAAVAGAAARSAPSVPAATPPPLPPAAAEPRDARPRGSAAATPAAAPPATSGWVGNGADDGPADGDGPLTPGATGGHAMDRLALESAVRVLHDMAPRLAETEFVDLVASQPEQVQFTVCFMVELCSLFSMV